MERSPGKPKPSVRPYIAMDPCYCPDSVHTHTRNTQLSLCSNQQLFVTSTRTLNSNINV